MKESPMCTKFSSLSLTLVILISTGRKSTADRSEELCLWGAIFKHSVDTSISYYYSRYMTLETSMMEKVLFFQLDKTLPSDVLGPSPIIHKV